MSPACRASNGAIPPVWWRCHRQARHARVPVKRNSPHLMAQSSASKSRTGPRVAQLPPFDGGEAAVRGSEVTVRGSEVTPRGGAAHSANHLDSKRRQRGVVGEMTCVVDATAPPGASLAREPPTMRVNPVTRTPTPRYAPGRRRRACHQTPTRIRGPTRESAGPRANQWIHARMSGSTCAARNAGSSRLEQFRMQFD